MSHLRPSHVICDACYRLTAWPRWVRREHLDYLPLCAECYRDLFLSFTAAAAIREARAIVRQAQRKGITT